MHNYGQWVCLENWAYLQCLEIRDLAPNFGIWFGHDEDITNDYGWRICLKALWIWKKNDKAVDLGFSPTFSDKLLVPFFVWRLCHQNGQITATCGLWNSWTIPYPLFIIYSQQYSFNLNPFVHEQCRETTRKLSGLRAFNILYSWIGVCLETT